MANISDYFGSSGGGGAGDTYTASTAIAKNPIVAGKSYALTSDGGIVTPAGGTIASVGGFDTTQFVNSHEYSVSIYGDVFLPDAETSGAYFVITTDAHGSYPGKLFVNKGGVPTELGGTEIGINMENYWQQVSYSAVYLKNYAEDNTYWYYALMGMKRGSSDTYYRSGWYTFAVTKASHAFPGSNYANPYYKTWDSWDDNNSDRNRAEGMFVGNSNNELVVDSLRGGTKLIRMRGNAYNDNYVSVETANLESSGNYANLYNASTGSQGISTLSEGSHVAYFKVDDANGKFIILYTKDGDAGYSYYHGSTPASGNTTYSSEIDVSGTLGSNMQYAHFIATANPLVYYATYLDSSTTLSYQKITFASDLTSASMATMATLTVPGGYGSYMGGTTYWARQYDEGIQRNQKLSIPGDEILLIWGSSDAASDTGRTLIFPASGTPSDGGTNTINTDFSRIGYTVGLTLTLANNGEHIVAHTHAASEAEGYDLVSAKKYAPYKNTVENVAIARAAGNVGDTINIDLKTGDTATAALSTDFYATKENMVYPLDVAGNVTAESKIKSIQRGRTYTGSSGGSSTTISPVNREKSTLNFTTYSGDGDGELSSSSRITFYKSSANYFNWEVIEYV